MILETIARFIQSRLQRRKIRVYKRRVSFGDLVSDRWQNAADMGFGEGSSMYDGVLVIGDRDHVKVGRHVWIGPGAILDGSGFLTIGDNCSISAGVQIYTHDTVNFVVNAENISHARTKIGNRVYIGPNSVIAKGVTIGDNVTIGAMSFVNSDIPSGAKAWGCPARVIGRATVKDSPPLYPVGYDAQ